MLHAAPRTQASLLLALALAAPAIAATVGGPVAPDGTEVQCDLPEQYHIRNRGGSDGAGLCVFASIEHAAIWQDVPEIQGIFEWMWRHPGGGWPEKVTRVINQMCKERGVAPPAYLQVEGNDLEILKLACKTGRMPGVTYCFSPAGRYRGRIAHMVSLVHADDERFGILDNNYPGSIEWMTPDEFRRVYACSTGWAVILLDSGPPPVCVN